VWFDLRNGNADVYAQRLAANGSPQWTSGGVAVCTAPEVQENACLANDGVGGAYVAWTDYRFGGYPSGADIYMQRITSLGEVAAGWPVNGKPVAASQVDDEAVPFVLSRPGNRVLVTWSSIGFGSVFAQLADSTGALLWGAGGLQLGNSTSAYPICWGLVDDDHGGGIVIWLNGSDDLYAQHIRSDGAVGWAPGGVAVSTAPRLQDQVSFVPDGGGGVLAAWRDARIDTSGRFPFDSTDVYAQNVRSDGALGGQVVAANIALVSAGLRDGAIRLDWFSPDGAQGQFTVVRVVDQAAPRSLATIVSDGTGHIRYKDGDVSAGHRYGYRLVGLVGRDSVLTDLAWVDVPSTTALSLGRPAPNPSTGGVGVSFVLPAASHVRLDVVDAGGRLVRQLLDQDLPAGAHSATWNGRTSRDLPAPSAVYFLRLESGGRILSRRIAEVR